MKAGIQSESIKVDFQILIYAFNQRKHCFKICLDLVVFQVLNWKVPGVYMIPDTVLTQNEPRPAGFSSLMFFI